MTLQRQVLWGQAPLFAPAVPAGSRRYRVFDGTTWGPATASLALAAAQARAIALIGRTAWVWADDGTGVTIVRSPSGFALAVDGPVPWAGQCHLLLERHG